MGLKIQKFQMRVITKKDNFYGWAYIPINDDGKEHRLTYAKGGCMSKCNHVYDHKLLFAKVVLVILTYITDG